MLVGILRRTFASSNLKQWASVDPRTMSSKTPAVGANLGEFAPNFQL
jgi:hypothetical protein